MEEEIWVSEESLRVSAKWKARAEAMRVKREKQVRAELWDAKEEASQTEVERQSDAMKPPLSSVSDCV